MSRNWEAIEGTELGWDLVEPNDPALARFDAGNEWYAREITDFVRQWAVRVRVEAVNPYNFGIGEQVIGYAFTTIASGPHSTDPRQQSADYYMIMALALDKSLRGSEDRPSGRRNVDVILEFLAARAVEGDDEATAVGRPALAGSALLVYADNARARRVYERNGFIPMAGNPVLRDRGEAIRLWRPLR
jgi:ribosomal protein S18 acetylase RimI-like enzyme